MSQSEPILRRQGTKLEVAQKPRKLLDFAAFCEFVRTYEPGKHTTKGLKARFDNLDDDNTGRVDLKEYLRFAMLEAMSRLVTSSVTTRAYQWDTDGNGRISRREFRAAIRHNFPVLCRTSDEFIPDDEIDEVFGEIDTDGSGCIDELEIIHKMRDYARGDVQKVA